METLGQSERWRCSGRGSPRHGAASLPSLLRQPPPQAQVLLQAAFDGNLRLVRSNSLSDRSPLRPLVFRR
uniref:Uncharacterized protein n=1 Tax=Oryza punctata TaxID=4537 RepID=A0A0E0JZZ3_ORYPU